MATITKEAAGNANVPAFLDLIAFSEGTSLSKLTKNAGYDVIVTGPDGPEAFTDYSDHPFAKGRAAKLVRKPDLYSTASGRYQLLLRYWRVYKTQLKLPDFSPLSQDKVAMQQMHERGALTLVKAHDIAGAIKACSNIWASFPGNDYGQGGHSVDELVSEFERIWSASFV